MEAPRHRGSIPMKNVYGTSSPCSAGGTETGKRNWLNFEAKIFVLHPTRKSEIAFEVRSIAEVYP